MNSPLDTLTKRFTPCVIICPCDKWLSQQLPLISDVIKNIGTKKVFIKMNLRWGYNNVRIKEGDE